MGLIAVSRPMDDRFHRRVTFYCILCVIATEISNWGRISRLSSRIPVNRASTLKRSCRLKDSNIVRYRVLMSTALSDFGQYTWPSLNPLYALEKIDICTAIDCYTCTP